MEKIARLNDRGWHFSKLPISNQSSSIVLLGDSMFKYTEVGNFPVDLEPWTSLLGTQNVFNYSTSGMRIRNLWDYGNPTHLQETLDKDPDFVLISVGANNRPDSNTAIESEYIYLGQALESAGIPFTFSIVFPCTEGYRDQYNNGFNTRIPEIITILKNVCDTYGWEYVDLRKQLIYKSFSDGLDYLREDYSSDGLHLNNKGYREWSKAISRYINTKI